MAHKQTKLFTAYSVDTSLGQTFVWKDWEKRAFVNKQVLRKKRGTPSLTAQLVTILDSMHRRVRKGVPDLVLTNRSVAIGQSGTGRGACYRRPMIWLISSDSDVSVIVPISQKDVPLGFIDYSFDWREIPYL